MSASSKNPLWLRCLAWLLGLCAVGLALVLFHEPMLRGAAELYVVDEPVAKADAIVVLGGGVEYRPLAAARYYLEGRAPKVLVTQPQLSPSAKMGLTTPEFVLAREILLKRGVPAAAIQMLGTNVASTRDEALALKQWVVENHAKTVLIPTDPFHTRRARWIFCKILKPAGVSVRMAVAENPSYKVESWWRTETGLITFQNEVVKFGYYMLKF